MHSKNRTQRKRTNNKGIKNIAKNEGVTEQRMLKMGVGSNTM